MMNLITEYVNPSEGRKGILKALANLGLNDLDFCGDNGEEYLWDDAKSKGFESNCDYLVDYVDKNFTDPWLMIKKFFEFWLGDNSYYSEYSYRTIINENHDLIAIAVAYVC